MRIFLGKICVFLKPPNSGELNPSNSMELPKLLYAKPQSVKCVMVLIFSSKGLLVIIPNRDYQEAFFDILKYRLCL